MTAVELVVEYGKREREQSGDTMRRYWDGFLASAYAALYGIDDDADDCVFSLYMDLSDNADNEEQRSLAEALKREHGAVIGKFAGEITDMVDRLQTE